MGYDMSIKGDVAANDAGEIDAAKQAYRDAATAHRARMEAARKAGTYTHELDNESGKEFDKLYGKYRSLAYPGDFRLNIFGMSRYRDAMLELGMAHESRSLATQSDWESLPEDYDSDSEEAYYEALDKITSRHAEGTAPTIPLHKFGTNDGWLVTPDEIRASLAKWDEWNGAVLTSKETADLVGTEYWGKWIDYLRLAADHDGFRVH